MPTLLAYTEAIAYGLDDLEVFTAGGGDASSFSSVSLVNADTNASTHNYDGRWAFNATQGLQRSTRTGTHVLAPGSLGIAPIWTPPNSNDRIDLTRFFPRFETGPYTASMSYRKIVNQTLQMIVVPDRLSIAIVPGQQEYSLQPWQKWLDREERFGWPDIVLSNGTHVAQARLLEPGPGGTIGIPADWRRPHLRLDADAPYLEIETPFVTGTTGTIFLRVLRPSNTWVFLGGAWSESVNDGLANDTDQARPSVEDVRKIGTWIAVDTLAKRGVTGANGRWSDKVAAAKAEAMSVKWFDRTQVAAIEQQPQQPAGVAA